MSAALPKPLTFQEFQQRRRSSSPPERPVEDVGWSDRMAVWMTTRVGTMGFFLLILVWTVLWLGWNFLAPKDLQFDPPMGFVFWLFISNVIQLLLLPLIMVGQNVLARYADRRAENDLEVNVKSEEEIEIILHHLEYQNSILLALVKKMDVTLEAALPSETGNSF